MLAESLALSGASILTNSSALLFLKHQRALVVTHLSAVGLQGFHKDTGKTVLNFIVKHNNFYRVINNNVVLCPTVITLYYS